MRDPQHAHKQQSYKTTVRFLALFTNGQPSTSLRRFVRLERSLGSQTEALGREVGLGGRRRERIGRIPKTPRPRGCSGPKIRAMLREEARLTAQGAEGEGHLTKAAQEGERDGEVNHHAAHGANHACAQLQESLP